MRKRSWLLVVVLIAATGACRTASRASASPTAEAQEPSKDVAPFEFDWPEGMALDADVRKKVRRSGGTSKSFHAGYRLRAEEQSEGLLVEIHPESEVETGGAEEVELSSAVATASSVVLPNFSVTASGAFRGVSGVDSDRQKQLQFVRSLKGEELENREVRAVKSMLGREFLASRAREFWELLVGTWAGSEIPVGETQTTERADTFEFPVVGEREIRLEFDFTVEERIACSSRPEASAGSEPGCVRIVMKSRPDVQKMKEVLQPHVDRISARKANHRGMDDVPQLTVADVFIRSEMTLVTEPATLRPHRWTDEKTVRMTLRGPNGRERSYKMVDETQTVFRAAEQG